MIRHFVISPSFVLASTGACTFARKNSALLIIQFSRDQTSVQYRARSYGKYSHVRKQRRDCVLPTGRKRSSTSEPRVLHSREGKVPSRASACLNFRNENENADRRNRRARQDSSCENTRARARLLRHLASSFLFRVGNNKFEFRSVCERLPRFTIRMRVLEIIARARACMHRFTQRPSVALYSDVYSLWLFTRDSLALHLCACNPRFTRIRAISSPLPFPPPRIGHADTEVSRAHARARAREVPQTEVKILGLAFYFFSSLSVSLSLFPSGRHPADTHARARLSIPLLEKIRATRTFTHYNSPSLAVFRAEYIYSSCRHEFFFSSEIHRNTYRSDYTGDGTAEGRRGERALIAG